jgi:hypothetical protein
MSIDRYGLREVVTRQFYEQHVLQIPEHDAEKFFTLLSHKEKKKLEEYASKAANMMYQNRERRVAINTVIVFGRVDADRLKHEVRNNQLAYGQRDGELAALRRRRRDVLDSVYVTPHRFAYYERELQRAEYRGVAYLRYGSADNHGQDADHEPSEGRPGFFKISHLELMSRAADRTEGGRLDERFGLWIFPPRRFLPTQVRWDAELRFWVEV